MKKAGSKNSFRRILLGLVQHIVMAGVALTMIMVFQDSIIRTNEWGDGRNYKIDFSDNATAFEDTAVYNQMFLDTVNDLATLIGLKSRFETDGRYDEQKLINVTEFVHPQEGLDKDSLTVYYHLDNLIRWGRSGIDMITQHLTKKQFVNYFNDDLLELNHFYLNENNELRYSGNVIADREQQILSMLPEGIDFEQLEEEERQSYISLQTTHLQELYNNYLRYNENQLVDMAFNYIAANMDKTVSLVEEKGELVVELELLRSKYLTAITEEPLINIADNWIDYCKLEKNVIEVLNTIKTEFGLYEQKNEMYLINNTNVRYFFRIQDEESSSYYTNLPEWYLVLENEELDYAFQDLGHYLIYSVSSNLCESTVNISDEDMFAIINGTYSYVYLKDSIIWIGVLDEHSVDNDYFAVGRSSFETVVLHFKKYAMIIALCLLLWLSLWSYLTFTAGRVENEDGTISIRLNWFDRLHTEFILLSAFAIFYVFKIALQIFLAAIADGGYTNGAYLSNLFKQFEWSSYVISIFYGFLASFIFCIIWYSIVRRIKAGNIWRDSFLHWLFSKLHAGTSMVLYHKSTAIRTLIPYNVFLILNLSAVVAIYLLQGRTVLLIGLILITLVFDASVGVLLFRNNAEMREIVEAINQIRQGEVEYRLEPEKLHGENQEIAEAVNNISEGIRNAVATSVKDERLKSDLITNVSHDIKTPLTSIINYVDLLKREKIEQEPVKSYITILDTKTQRLKQLTDDLVEASKISSGNIVLQKERLDLIELFQQAIGEFSEKFEEQKLMLVFEQLSKETYIYADSRRMWRVIENLFNNICKYAMPDTRVYLEVRKENGIVEATLKNISKQQLNIHAEDLTERFIRGDESRTTEGSGLGLSITKSLTEVQGGSFQISLDGDLFKVTLQFPEMVKN